MLKLVFCDVTPHSLVDITNVSNECADDYYFNPEEGGSKGKAIPLQAWTGPEGSRRLRLPDFKTIITCRW